MSNMLWYIYRELHVLGSGLHAQTPPGILHVPYVHSHVLDRHHVREYEDHKSKRENHILRHDGLFAHWKHLIPCMAQWINIQDCSHATVLCCLALRIMHIVASIWKVAMGPGVEDNNSSLLTAIGSRLRKQFLSFSRMSSRAAKYLLIASRDSRELECHFASNMTLLHNWKSEFGAAQHIPSYICDEKHCYLTNIWLLVVHFVRTKSRTERN